MTSIQLQGFFRARALLSLYSSSIKCVEDISDTSVVKKIYLVLLRLWFLVSEFLVCLFNLKYTKKAHLRNSLKLMKNTEAKTSVLSCYVGWFFG